MKTFPIAVVAVALVTALICVQERDAAAVTENSGLVELRTDSGVLDLDQDVPEDSWMSMDTPYKSVLMRNRHCRFCCGCCNINGCGMCCRKLPRRPAANMGK